MTKVGVIGATGYAGLELCRLLVTHPMVELAAISSTSFEGKTLSEVYPSIAGFVDLKLVSSDKVVAQCDIIFASLPHGLSQELAGECNKQGKILIDLGADFRLTCESDYKEWYQGEFLDKALHHSAVYGLPELFENEIKEAKLIANPGCYPTSVALGLAPLVSENLIQLNNIIIDAKSGVTGAGRSATETTHYVNCNEAFAPYKIAEHRHTPEIEQTLSYLSGEDTIITFVPHLLPVNRGILSTIYVNPVESFEAENLHKLYTDFYKNKKFVRVLPIGKAANLKNVTYSNYCDISLHIDKRTGRIIVVSAIDNMLKGASGQAIQNMNLVCGFPEDTALTLVPPAF